tara:strand:+ start:86 stop:1171 length:1086 start_codon:yes stop_codon:yes gene_type:complete
MLYLLSSNALALSLSPAVQSRAAAPRMAFAESYRIAPSILSADFARLGQEVEDVLKAGADTVHFDVMDNHYVPNLTIGPLVCKALKDYGIEAPIDVHMMVSPVDQLINDFADAGADYITFHPEATGHIDRSLQLVRSRGCKSGLVFNPGTSLDCLKYVMDKVDIILLMSVNPGFGGQAFIPATLDKAREARALITESGFDISLQIDGGVKPDNIKEIAEAGVDMFVAGSAIFNSAPRRPRHNLSARPCPALAPPTGSAPALHAMPSDRPRIAPRCRVGSSRLQGDHRRHARGAGAGALPGQGGGGQVERRGRRPASRFASVLWGCRGRQCHRCRGFRGRQCHRCRARGLVRGGVGRERAYD